MKNMLFGFAVVVAVFIGVCFGIYRIDTTTEDMLVHIEYARGFTQSGDFASASQEIRAAMNIWEDSGFYTHICIRNSELDETTDTFFKALSDISSENKEVSLISIEKLTLHLLSVQEMEHASLRTVF